MATKAETKLVDLLGIDEQVLTLALARMVDAFGNSFLIIVLPLYIASGAITGGTLGLSEALITGIILSAFGLLNSSAQPFTGRLSDRVGRRKVFVLIGLGVLAVADFSYSLVSSYLSVLAVRALQGVGVAFTVPATVALVNELATDETRGGSMGVFNTFRLLGFGAGPIVAGTVVARGPYTLSPIGSELRISGFDAAFYVAALFAAVSFLLVTLLIDDPETTPTDAGDDLAVSVLAHDDEHTFDPVFALGLATLFMAIGLTLFSTIQPAVNARLDQGPGLFGIEFGAFAAAQVLLQAPIGSATDRYGRRQFIVLGLVLLTPVTFAQGVVVEPWQMVLARFLQGVAGAMVFAPALALAGDLAKEGQSGTQLSVLTMAFGLGSAIGPLSSGVLIGYGFVYPFAFGGVLAAIGTVLVYTQVEETVAVEETMTYHLCRIVTGREC